MPVVGVVMPASRVSPYTGEAIESVLGQIYADLELFVVDDGSTDGSDVMLSTAYNVRRAARQRIA
jgi:glycosyltransferase involved in cell wall biosynthesis